MHNNEFSLLVTGCLYVGADNQSAPETDGIQLLHKNTASKAAAG
jgi:hypothetical protein